MKIGIGFDVHRFVAGKALIIGGVSIPFEKGLLGHSDADVLTHAIIDALLGAISEGDIGTLFPDSDPSYLGISSMVLLEKTMKLVVRKGYCLENVDTIILAEKPKIGAFRMTIQEKLGKIMGLDPNEVSIKATTTEKLGFVGREEGIAAHAVVLLTKKQ